MKVKVFFKDGYVKDDKQKNVYYFLTNFNGDTKIERVISEKEYEVNDTIEVAKSKTYGNYFIANKK